MSENEKDPIRLIPAPLIEWFRLNKRDLPWRVNPTPYRVWVSEIMLQQTRVEAAREYYIRFLSELPTVFDLAACPEEKLLKLWEGLGYYSRVKNMQKAAKLVVEKYAGEFPCDKKSLLALPGIGDYTVGAIMSIAFFLPQPAVDGNVMRVLSRYTQNGTDISSPAYKKELAERLEKVYPQKGQACSDFTQGLMELGALICTPSSPACEICPLKATCAAQKNGTQAEYPVMPKKKEKRQEELFVFVIQTPRGISVRKREKGVLKGLNEFPSCPAQGDEKAALEEMGVVGAKIVKKQDFSHIFTHIRWDMRCFLVTAETSPFEEYPLRELTGSVALPTAFKQCLAILESK